MKLGIKFGLCPNPRCAKNVVYASVAGETALCYWCLSGTVTLYASVSEIPPT